MSLPRERRTQPCPPEGERAATVARLRAENARLHQALDSHAVVDQAIGVLIALHRLSAGSGWEILREVSRHSDITVREVADLVIGWPQGHPMPAPVRDELDDALRRRRRDSGATPEHGCP
ncbi:ANTAR domain-containing protein [Streptomyces fagopyri]|uniref:ANTAR domain-containing protein n=1 Tax=Streptomyces fagopyri TaxID=2662397 RepID=UPI001D17B889|nr:ANTAR domain-containing protein [Streptomyces fagopyri]